MVTTIQNSIPLIECFLSSPTIRNTYCTFIWKSHLSEVISAGSCFSCSIYLGNISFIPWCHGFNTKEHMFFAQQELAYLWRVSYIFKCLNPILNEKPLNLFLYKAQFLQLKPICSTMQQHIVPEMFKDLMHSKMRIIIILKLANFQLIIIGTSFYVCDQDFMRESQFSTLDGNYLQIVRESYPNYLLSLMKQNNGRLHYTSKTALLGKGVGGKGIHHMVNIIL